MGGEENALAVTVLPPDLSISMEDLLLETAIPAVRPRGFKKEREDEIDDESFKSGNINTSNCTFDSEGRCKVHQQERQAAVQGSRRRKVPAVHFDPLPLVTGANENSTEDDDTMEMDTADRNYAHDSFPAWEMRF
jgi:hypothetical protein